MAKLIDAPARAVKTVLETVTGKRAHDRAFSAYQANATQSPRRGWRPTEPWSWADGKGER